MDFYAALKTYSLLWGISRLSVFRILYQSFPLIKLLSFLDGPPKAGSVCFILPIPILYHWFCNYSSLCFSASLSSSLSVSFPPAQRGKDHILKIFKSLGPSIKPGTVQTTLCVVNPTAKLYPPVNYKGTF